MPTDACFFKPSRPFHQFVESYRLFECFGIFFQEKPQTLPATEREEQSSGVAALQEPNVQAVGQLSLWVGHESNNGHGIAQNGNSRLVEPVRDFTNPLRSHIGRNYVPIAQGSDDVGESEAAGF